MSMSIPTTQQPIAAAELAANPNPAADAAVDPAFSMLMDEALVIMRDGDPKTKMAKDCINVIGTLVSPPEKVSESLEKLFDKTFGRVLKTPPSFRLHEIVLEMLVLVDDDDSGPGPFARKALLKFAMEFAKDDPKRAEKFIKYSENTDFKAAMFLYIFRTSPEKNDNVMTHEQAFGMVPAVWKPEALRFFAASPQVRGSKSLKKREREEE
jgi:hypothetical protein